MILERLLDRLPILARLAHGSFGDQVRVRIRQVFPERPVAERESILRGYLRHRLANRAVYKCTLRFPVLAALIGRAVPIQGKRELMRANAHSGPIVIATAHYGSLYLQILIYARFMRGRRILIMHERDFVDAARDQAFLRSRGIVPVPNDAHGLHALVRALRANPQTAIFMAFDPTMGSRHAMRFLGTTIPVSMGIGLLADVGGCGVLPLFWECRGWRPRIAVDSMLSVDESLPAAQRRIAIVETLYRRLEAQVARLPEQWMLWEYIRDVPVGARRRSGSG